MNQRIIIWTIHSYFIWEAVRGLFTKKYWRLSDFLMTVLHTIMPFVALMYSIYDRFSHCVIVVVCRFLTSLGHFLVSSCFGLSDWEDGFVTISRPGAAFYQICIKHTIKFCQIDGVILLRPQSFFGGPKFHQEMRYGQLCFYCKCPGHRSDLRTHSAGRVNF